MSAVFWALCWAFFFVISISSAVYSQEFTPVTPGRQFLFPRDHGAHPGFQTEWWYFTGQLWENKDGSFTEPPRYGYQLTFFRRSKDPDFPASDGYLAHAAIADFKRGSFHFARRAAGSTLGLAGADERTLRVWHRDWTADRVGDTLMLSMSAELANRNVDSSPPILRLASKIDAGPWLQGEAGYSKKSACEQCASYYYSIPLLRLSGELLSESSVTPLYGLGWMDHEFMSSALAENQTGWDWFSIMLKDGTALMIFDIRSQEENGGSRSGSMWKRGAATQLSRKDIDIQALETWKSPRSGAVYPSRWRITIPSEGLDLILRTRMPNQELFWDSEKDGELGPSAYYEGAIAAADESALGFVELTGYDRPLGRLF